MRITNIRIGIFAKAILAFLLLFMWFLGCQGQVKPVNDTIKFVQSVDNSQNVLTNDIGPNLKVTSWTLNGVKKDTGKMVAITGIGKVTINGRGLLIFDNTNDSFIGALPAITYIANNTLSRGVSAKVFVNITKRPVASEPVKPQFRIYKLNGQVLVDYIGIVYVGELQDYYDGCKHLYAVIADNSYYPISKTEYDRLLN